MRIALVSPELPSRLGGGGIGTYTAIAGRALAELGHEVCIVTRGPAGRCEDDGLTVVSLERPYLRSAEASRLLALRRIAGAVRGFRADVVQAPEWEAEGWWIARRASTPLVTRLATPTYLVETLNGRQPARASAPVRRLERDQARRSAALIAPSRAIAERVGTDWELDSGAIEVIPNPLDIAAVRAAAQREPAVELPCRFLAFIGRLERRKGVLELAVALPRVLAGQPDLHCVLVGRDAGEQGGAVREELLEATEPVRDRVHLLGELPRESALSVVARAELVVLPSRWEAFGFVATEALALGRAVVATSGSGLAEVIEDGRSGWLVPPGDADALRRILERRLADPSGLRRASEEAVRRASDFEAVRIAERLAALYERVLRERRSGRFDRSIYTGGYRRYFRPGERTGPFHRLYEQKRKAVLQIFDVPERLRLVDVGAGPGRLTAPLAERHEMTACDISEQMLEEARRVSPPGVRFVRADARELPFEDNEFDGLLALDLLAHLPHITAGIQELARVVRPGGTLVFDTSNASPWWVLAYPSYVNWRPRRLAKTMLAGGVLPEWRAVVRHHRAAEARAAIEAAGLRLERQRSFGPPWCPKWHLWLVTKPSGP
jgi:glycogen(starch) synthase